MNKTQVATWDEARDALLDAADEEACARLDAALADGRTVTAAAVLMEFGISVQDD